MNTIQLKMVTLVCDPVLEFRLLEEIKQAGAAGHRASEVRGEGAWEMIGGGREGSRRYIKIETIVTPEIADKIVTHVATNYFDRYSILVYMSNVEVVRGDKFSQAFQRKMI